MRTVTYYPHPEFRKGQLYAGNPVSFGSCLIDLTADVYIGDYCMIGHGTQLLTHDHYHYGTRPLSLLQKEKGVQWHDKRLGKDVWLHDCTVLMQCEEIADGVVVGAKSVVTKNLSVPYAIYAGNPAKQIGHREEIMKEPEKFENSVVAADFVHGNNFKMGPFCVIEDGCVVGDDVTIGPFCHFKANTIIGNRVKIDSYVKSSGQNRIGNNVTLRYNSTIAREVVVEDFCYISPNVMTNYQKADGGHQGGTVIGKGSFIGTGTVIHHGVKIAPGTVVGAMSFVNKDIVEPGKYIGVPAKRM